MLGIICLSALLEVQVLLCPHHTRHRQPPLSPILSAPSHPRHLHDFFFYSALFLPVYIIPTNPVQSSRKRHLSYSPHTSTTLHPPPPP
ncbi:hypothetical protein DFP73DRAFT_543047, partial [Morchella snyderi]